MNNSKVINGNWAEIKEKLKKKFGMLTESDLLVVRGRQEEMLERLQKKLGRTKEEVYKIISDL